jgi:hypothetical protein
VGWAHVNNPDTQLTRERFGDQIGTALRAHRPGTDCIIEVHHGPSLAPAGGEGTGPLALPLAVLSRSRSVFC